MEPLASFPMLEAMHSVHGSRALLHAVRSVPTFVGMWLLPVILLTANTRSLQLERNFMSNFLLPYTPASTEYEIKE